MDELSARRMIEMLPRLRRFAYGLCGDLGLADDVVQTTCERAIDKFVLWRRGTNLESWLFTIARNAYLDLYRNQRVRMAHAVDARATSVQSVDGERVAEDGVTMAHLVRHLAAMAEEQSSALLLAMVEGLTYEEIARIQDVPVGTVTSRIGRARQVLREAMTADPVPSAAQREGGGTCVSNR